MTTNPAGQEPAALPQLIYDADGVALYQGDSAALIDRMPPGMVDLVLTDPPYGMGYKPLRGSDGSKMWRDAIIGDNAPFDPRPLLKFPRVILFGANWYADKLPPSGGWLVWDKTPRQKRAGFIQSEAELAWVSPAMLGRVLTFALQWGGNDRNGEAHLHPTQKPLALMRDLIERFSEPGQLIFDPFAGSGTTLVAARNTGRRAIGCEILPHFVGTTIARLSQKVMSI